MIVLYNLFIQVYFAAIKIASLWNKKAAAWVEGRKHLWTDLEKTAVPGARTIWMHCSSYGEFEQGKPLIEGLKKQYPRHRIFVSFFSPSGFNAAKNYTVADLLIYLPLDTRKNAEHFVKLVNPDLVIFVKYEFWYYHLNAVAFRHIPLLLVSATFRKEQLFFKPYGKFFRQLLFLFRHIFVQDRHSFDLLKENGILHCSISGDTRFDRVKEISDKPSPIPVIENFTGHNKIIVAGSTWIDDEKLLADFLHADPDVKLILAPHEIDSAHISSLKNLFPNHILFSEYEAVGTKNHVQVLIIDCVGLLSRLYQYATITYVGGGFTKDGIHNILEAAVWGKPVLFGPNYKKYREAGEMIKCGGAFSISSSQELKKLAEDFFTNKNHLQVVGKNARNYVSENTGATERILQMIYEKRLLTS